MELNEKSLELVVSEKSLGKLITNAEQVKELVLSILPKYSIENYSEANVDQAKKDKALLNSSAKVLNDKRIELEKEFMKPFNEFKEVITETVKLIGDATKQIDSVVKESEAKEKAKKHSEIENYWNDKEFTLIPLSKIYQDKWLNKSVSLKSVKSQIDEAVAKIEDDLKTLDAIGEDVDLLKSLYLDTLNINTTIQYSNTLKENRKKVQKTETKAPELETTAPEVKTSEDPEVDVFAEEPTPEISTPNAQEAEELLERVMLVRGTREQIIALGDWMYDNGIHFEKLEHVVRV